MKERFTSSVGKGIRVAKEIVPIVRSFGAVIAPSGLGITIVKESSLPYILAFGIATGITYLPLMISRRDKGKSRKEE